MAFQPILEILQRTAPISVLDVPHAWNEWTRSLLADVDEVVISAAPDLANLRNTKNLFDSLKKLRPNDKPPYLVLNQVGMPKRPEIAPQDFCEPLETDPIAIIPFDVQLFGVAANSGRMIGEMDGKSSVAEIMSQIAHIVTGRVAVKKAKRGGLGSLLGKLGKKQKA
jgi:pilus assembly protein CpaE